MRKILKLILKIVGGLILILVFILGIGYLLPVSHEATVKGHLPLSLDETWQVITDYKSFPSWRSEVMSIEELNNGSWTEFYSWDGQISFEHSEKVENEKLVTTIISQDLPYGGKWTFTLEPAESGTMLTITENGDVYHPFFRFVSTFFIGHDSTLKTYMSDIENKSQNK